MAASSGGRRPYPGYGVRRQHRHGPRCCARSRRAAAEGEERAARTAGRGRAGGGLLACVLTVVLPWVASPIRGVLATGHEGGARERVLREWQRVAFWQEHSSCRPCRSRWRAGAIDRVALAPGLRTQRSGPGSSDPYSKKGPRAPGGNL